MNDYVALLRRDPLSAASATVAVIGALTICGFLFFQYVLGYPPCPLCLDQRNAFYVSVPLAALLWLGANYSASSKVMIAGFAVITAIMLWNAGLSAYHAGVEWKFWRGPSGLFRADQQSWFCQRYAQAASEHQDRAVRRGSLALPGYFAGRL